MDSVYHEKKACCKGNLMKKLSLWAGLLLCLSLLLTACNAEESKTAGSSEMLLDTVCSVTLFQPADQELADRLWSW